MLFTRSNTLQHPLHHKSNTLHPFHPRSYMPQSPLTPGSSTPFTPRVRHSNTLHPFHPRSNTPHPFNHSNTPHQDKCTYHSTPELKHLTPRGDALAPDEQHISAPSPQSEKVVGSTPVPRVSLCPDEFPSSASLSSTSSSSQRRQTGTYMTILPPQVKPVQEKPSHRCQAFKGLYVEEI
ncbi:hypothetical protein WMY93_019424 [Mugilogobius chulae]|uniref:Uncharacterized protein n=1 Tax=Mugilogobius chulae TaxID=88201 RepID=A0AAW0NR39_9GOBI